MDNEVEHVKPRCRPNTAWTKMVSMAWYGIVGLNIPLDAL